MRDFFLYIEIFFIVFFFIVYSNDTLSMLPIYLSLSNSLYISFPIAKEELFVFICLISQRLLRFICYFR